MTAALAASIHTVAVLGFVALLMAAAASDMRSLVIPNRLCLAIAALWPAFALSGAGPVAWTAAATVAGTTFAIGFAMFAAGFTGGGDVKLIAAIALWAGPGSIVELVLVTALAGGLISLILLCAARFQPAPADANAGIRRSFFRINVPYGAAIAIGGLAVAGRLAAF